MIFIFVAIAVILAVAFPKYAVYISLTMLLILFLHLFRIVYKMQHKSEGFVMIGGGVATDKMVADGYVNKQQIETAKQAQIGKGIANPSDADIIKQLVLNGAVTQAIADKYSSLASAPQFSMEALENLASMYREGTLKVKNLDVTGDVLVGNKLFVEKDVVVANNLYLVDKATDPTKPSYNTQLTSKGDIKTPKVLIIGNQSENDKKIGTVMRIAENFENKNLLNRSEIQFYVANPSDVNTSGMRIIDPNIQHQSVNIRAWDDGIIHRGAIYYYNDGNHHL
jgi:hypothetical protein